MILKKGKFITLEGGEGVGKTTNVSFIKSYLQDQNISILISREPGGTQLAEKIRELLLQPNDEDLTSHAEILLMFAARSQHVTHVIKPALARGEWVLCDRFTDSTFAYQGGGRGMSFDTISWLENLVQDELRPDLTLLLDIPVETGLARAKNRGGQVDRFEAEHLQFFDRIRDVYLQRAQQFPHRIKIIAADQSLDDVQLAIIESLKPMLL